MFWVAQSLVIAEGDSGAPGRLHLPSKLLGWNTGARGRLHSPSNLFGWNTRGLRRIASPQRPAGEVGHLLSNVLEWQYGIRSPMAGA